MLTSVHFLTGAAVATQTPELIPASIAVVVLHLVLDAVPHKGYIDIPIMTKSNTILFISDVALALILFFIFIPKTNFWYAFSLGMMAVSPDIISGFVHLFPKLKQFPPIKSFYNWHSDTIQHEREPQFKFLQGNTLKAWLWGVIPQIIVLLVSIYFIRH